MDRDTPVLIAAYSGRALAASARRAGYAPLVADFFGDDDTLAASRAHVRLCSGLDRGIEADELDAAFAKLADGSTPAGFVCGTGFEDRTGVIARMAARWPLIGNSPEVIERVKDPEMFAALCRACGVPHPETTRSQPDDPQGWLVKRIGGAGGTHITLANGKSEQADGRYFQRRVAGQPVSALVLAEGRRALVLGFSVQWTAPTPRHPYRYAGAARPAPIAPAIAEDMTGMVQRLCAELALVGLNSFDFLLDGATFHLLEINPRPGATLDIFEPEEDSLFALHVAACRGTLPVRPPRYAAAKASAILYADKTIAAVPAFDWPDWTADRPPAGSRVPAETPICTVMASASSAAAARRRVAERSRRLLADLDLAQS
ncbi:ATP-grasp domain-containing protein [Xanthobacteraceae bacterium Astr-EGSB]|uniref:ATP-grasp domain-containing protein n=1 Tax=Astrobacterium formosum TaxID=3069710 RepID=UPI0027B0EB6C|nr:ATP-grasp domain-containing protein [Xanthobacteraceae bacterium Astr-EGSB]